MGEVRAMRDERNVRQEVERRERKREKERERE